MFIYIYLPFPIYIYEKINENFIAQSEWDKKKIKLMTMRLLMVCRSHYCIDYAMAIHFNAIVESALWMFYQTESEMHSVQKVG